MSAETYDYLWAVMRAERWDALEIRGFPIRAPDIGPQRFIPVFNTKAEAIAWNGMEGTISAHFCPTLRQMQQFGRTNSLFAGLSVLWPRYSIMSRISCWYSKVRRVLAKA